MTLGLSDRRRPETEWLYAALALFVSTLALGRSSLQETPVR
jgi:hypothetical protein